MNAAASSPVMVTDLGNVGDQHCADNRADPRNWTEDDGHLWQVIIARDGPGDLVFQFHDQAVDPLLQLGVDVLEHRGGAQLLMRTNLGQERVCASRPDELFWTSKRGEHVTFPQEGSGLLRAGIQ